MNTVRIESVGRVIAVGLLLAVVTLYGCGRKNAASFVESARAYAAKADYKAAAIEAKNALQKDPNNGEARVLLATSLLETGDAPGAETEVRKAIDLHMPDARTYPLLARALGAQGEYKKLAAELANRNFDDPDVRSDVNVALAMASLAQGDVASGKQRIDAALADRPANGRALLLKARLVVRDAGGIASARGLIDAALKSSPNDIDALLMKSELDIAEDKRDDAQKVLEQAIDAHPGSVAARAALISLAMSEGKQDIAKAQVAKLKAQAPKDLRTMYADAFVSAAQGDTTHARDTIQRVLVAAPNHLQSLFLGGLVDYQLGAYSSAEERLRKVVTRVPEHTGARRALALVLLRTGRGQEALDTLTPALQRTPDDPMLLRTAGEVYLLQGNTRLAARSYERANAIDKNNVGSAVRLAQVRLAAGDTTRAFNDLEALANQDPSAYQADLTLINAHLRRREYDKAMAAVDALDKKLPNKAFVHHMRGVVYLAKRDLKDARASFEKALEVQPDFLAAARNLAIIDLQEGKPQAARERYEKLLVKNPKNEGILLMLAEIQSVSGVPPDQVKDAINKAIIANPASVPARLALISFEARRRDSKAAMTAAQSALGAIPNNAQLTEALGATQLAAGETNQAIDTFKRLVQLQPQNPLALLRLAEAQMAVKDYPAAIDSERRALALKPELPQGIVALTKTYLAAGRAGEAIGEARRLQKEHPDKSGGYVLEGEILAAQSKWSEAAITFKAGLDRQPVPAVAARYYAALVKAGKATEANAMAAKWMREHPDDSSIPLILAQSAQARNDLAAAKSGYQKVLDIDADSVIALNNLAWILADQKDPKAVEYAERAHRLAPFAPSVLDTLGWTLARTGESKRGVQLLRMASRLAPTQGNIRLHLAKALIESGDKAAAKQELAELAKLDKASPIRIEAEKLQATL